MNDFQNIDHHSKILVVDDEPEIRNGLSDSLRSMGYDVQTAESGEEALYQLKSQSDVKFVITDYKMPGLNGFDVLKEVKRASPTTPVVIMTGHGNIHHAVSAMQMGADDYLCKPFRFEDLEKIVVKTLPPEQTQIEMPSQTDILTQNQSFVEILRKAKRAARSNAPILIEGPSGTGKELLARQIHSWSDRSTKPWVAVNCAALPSGLLESELFGFEKGSFTGALDRRTGKFEQADTGTLLLDEIGELDPVLQAKLLRVLQEGEVDRIGGRKPQKVDVRIIATTNKNLAKLVRQGRFREDLYFRLYGVRFEMPSINERSDDIPLLAKYFLDMQSKALGRKFEFAVGTLESLQRRAWVGNIRELERAVERASILSESDLVSIADFEFSNDDSTNPDFQVFREAEESKTIKDLERETILNCLDAHSGNRTHTAKALGMSLRTLRHKLKQYREEGVPVTPARQSPYGNFSPVNSFDASLDQVKGESSWRNNCI